MHRTFSLTLSRPSDAFGISVPLARRFVRTTIHPIVWLVLLAVIGLFSIGYYVFQVNTSAQKTFTMRTLEKQAEKLEEVVAQLDQQVIRTQAMENLENRIKHMGYVPVDRYEFLRVSEREYALAKE